MRKLCFQPEFNFWRKTILRCLRKLFSKYTNFHKQFWCWGYNERGDSEKPRRVRALPSSSSSSHSHKMGETEEPWEDEKLVGDDAVHFTVFGSGLNMLPTTSLPIMPLLTTLWSTKDMNNPRLRPPLPKPSSARTWRSLPARWMRHRILDRPKLKDAEHQLDREEAERNRCLHPTDPDKAPWDREGCEGKTSVNI